MVQIRKAVLSDVEQICKIENESFSDPWSKKGFEDLLSDDNVKFITAMDEDVVIGYAVVYFAEDQADLANIAVSSLYRKKGIAEELITTVIELIKQDGVREIFLEVRESNTPAINLYCKNHFTNIGRRKSYYTAPIEDAIIMVRNI